MVVVLTPLHPSETVTESGLGARSGDFPSTRIWNVRLPYVLTSVPAVSGHHPNQFHPIPSQPGPSAWNLRPAVELTPAPPTFAIDALHFSSGLSQLDQPFPPPAWSPSHTSSRSPPAPPPPEDIVLAEVGAALDMEVVPAALAMAGSPPSQGG